MDVTNLKIPIDKICHIMAGFIVASIFTVLFGIRCGLLAGALAGAFKEALDEYRYSGADKFDFLATLAGAFLGAILFALIRV